MMNIETLHRFEQAVVHLLNFDGCDLNCTGGNFAHCDAIGITPRNITKLNY